MAEKWQVGIYLIHNSNKITEDVYHGNPRPPVHSSVFLANSKCVSPVVVLSSP